jgi:peptidoglycan/xylan/chitin deacetylase (PgdA/CDA1 family)
MTSLIIGIAAFLSLFGLEYKTAFFEIYLQGEWRVGNREVALTFDDCPMEPYTSQILDTLTEYNIKANFFIIGERALKYPEVIRRIHNEGHSIGNHGYTDKKPSLLSKDDTAEGIIETQNVLKKITGVRPKLFRLPSGIPQREIKKVVDKEKLRIIFTDVLLSNERQKTADEIVSHIIRNTKSGSIILLHGDHNGVVKALSNVIKGLEKRGLKFVILDDQ